MRTPVFRSTATRRFAEQVVAGAMAAVEIRGRRFDRQIDQPGFRIDGDLGPDAGVAVDRPRVVLPGLVAELAGARNRVERPDQLAGAHVERARQPFGVVVRDDREAFLERRADEHHVVDDGRRRVQADFAGLEIDRLPIAEDRAFLQVDDAVLAERRDRLAGLRIERDHAVAGGDEDHSIVAFAVGPVRDAAAGELARRDRGAVAFAEAVDPHQLAGLGVERDDRSARAAGRVEHALDHQRRAFELVLGTRAEAVGLEAPGDFELVEVAGVDLIERRVLAASQIGRVHRPLAVLGARLSRRARLSGKVGERWTRPRPRATITAGTVRKTVRDIVRLRERRVTEGGHSTPIQGAKKTRKLAYCPGLSPGRSTISIRAPAGPATYEKLIAGPFGSGQGPRLAGDRHALCPQTVDRVGQAARRSPADVIDRVPFARHRVAALGENPHVAEALRAVPDRVEPALELGPLAAELLQQPREDRFRIRTAQVDVMQAEQLGILHHFDARAPGILDEPKLEDAGTSRTGCDDLDARRLELLHLGVEIGEREADVIDRAARARLARSRCG